MVRVFIVRNGVTVRVNSGVQLVGSRLWAGPDSRRKPKVGSKFPSVTKDQKVRGEGQQVNQKKCLTSQMPYQLLMVIVDH